MRQVTHFKARSRDADHPVKIISDPGGPYLSSVIPCIETAQGFRKLSGINGHRAGCGAHAVDRAGKFPLIDVIIFHLPQPGGVFVGRSQS